MKRFLSGALIILTCYTLAAQEAEYQDTEYQDTEYQDTEYQDTEYLDFVNDPETEIDYDDNEYDDEAIDDEFIEAEIPEEVRELTQTERFLEMDIRTSSLTELATWCASLGLSTGGTRDVLANRLRAYYDLPLPAGSSSQDRRTIVIESARTTEYFTVEAIDEEYARLSGDVVVSLRDGEAVHRISAWEILYNRTRNVMTATGNVVYVKEEGTTVETFRGDSITVNLDNWSSIFLDGISERAMSGGGSAYRFSGTVISTNAEGATVLTGAEITNGQNPDALWSLNASKLWLLPGSDWAILNAVLKVGNIPVLWVPAFYLPADEIVFHPVVGTRPREGTFLQTTTYILGRPRSSTTVENSITKIFGSAPDGEKVQEGLFLRTTGRRVSSSDGTRLAVFLDAYTNLGFYLGTELALPRGNTFGAFNLAGGIGFTRNIYQVPYGNTPFAKFDGTSEWNSSGLFTLDVPFRYRLEMTGSVSIGNGTLTWNTPFYSDPYVNRDFTNRSEVLDWLAMLKEGASAQVTAQTSDTSTSSYQMRLSLSSFNPKLPAFFSPYITSISISGISSSLGVSSRTANPQPAIRASPPNPDNAFFFPNKLTILTLSASMSGTPYSTRTSSASQPAPTTDTNPLLPSLPIAPWEDSADDENIRDGESGVYNLSPPSLDQRFDTVLSAGGPRLSLTYSLSSTATSDLQFFNRDWKNSEDIDWSEIESVKTLIRANTSLGLSVSHSGGNAYSGSFRISGNSSWQGNNYLNEDAISDIGAERRRAYNQTYFTSSYNVSTSVRPLFRSSVWGNTSINYGFSGLFAKTVFDGSNVNSVVDDPKWTWEFGEWTKEKLDSHSVSATLSASIMDYVQSVTVSATLPPRNSQLSANATFNVWISTTSISNNIIEPFDNDKRVIQPINLSESLRFTSNVYGSLNLTYDPELEEMTSLSSSLTLWRLSATYRMSYISPYGLNYVGGVPSGWVQTGAKRFEPNDLSFSFSYSIPRKALWNNGPLFSAGFSSNLFFDLQRYTYSKLGVSFNIDMEIPRFMTLRFSTSSENAHMYRYFRNLPFFTTDVPLPPGVETNFFKDFLNSIRFDNTDLRRQSAFKLNTFNFDLVHYLGDWTATLSVRLSPYLDYTSSIPAWKFNNLITFAVRWIPIEEIRTEIEMDKDKLIVK